MYQSADLHRFLKQRIHIDIIIVEYTKSWGAVSTLILFTSYCLRTTCAVEIFRQSNKFWTLVALYHPYQSQVTKGLNKPKVELRCSLFYYKLLTLLNNLKTTLFPLSNKIEKGKQINKKTGWNCSFEFYLFA